MNKDTLGFVFSFLNNDCGFLLFTLNNHSIQWKVLDSFRLLIWSARNGFENLCSFIILHYPRNYNVDGNIVLINAAYCGHEYLCRIAKERYNANAFDEMMANAAMGGHENLCRLAKEWGVRHFNWMLNGGAYGGHENICRLAKKWGAGNFNLMIEYAAEGGHENICRLGKKWGAIYFNGMYNAAASKGYINISKLAQEWALGSKE